jgi:hypothetical protein
LHSDVPVELQAVHPRHTHVRQQQVNFAGIIAGRFQRGSAVVASGQDDEAGSLKNVQT